MKTTTPPMLRWIVRGFLAGAGLLLAGGCANETNAPQASAATQPTAQSSAEPGAAPALFDSDAAVASALLVAVKAQDHEQVHHLLGPAWNELSSGDPAEDAADFKDFAARAAEHMRIEKKDDSTSMLRVGNDDWLFPIPIVRNSNGKWFLDTEAGKSEMFARRIGQNELEAIQICRLYVKAQHEYASEDRDGSGGLQYAQRILSTPGKHDGLFWDDAPGQEQSPFARLIAKEKLEGYHAEPGKHTPYHGYSFRVLKQQGANAAGGKLSYVIKGNMTGGFALIAWPAVYESSGIMTFVVNQEGRVYQKDLGADTTHIARHMMEYDPDTIWTLVKD